MGAYRAAPTGPPWYQDLCDGWRRSLARRGRATDTQQAYGWLLRDFGRWLEHCRVERPEDLLPEVAYSWQDTLQRLAPASRGLAATALRGVLRWGAREGLGVPPGLWERIESVTVPQGQPRPLEPEDRDRLLAYLARHDRGLEQLRDRALFMFLLSTGSRIAPVLALNRDDIRGAGAVIVRQKGGDEHRLLPSAIARAWLDQYLRARGRDDQPALWIRIGARGRHRLLKPAANEIWRKVAKRAGIPPFTSHVIKHTAVTELGELTESDQEIADHVGWKGTQMMRRYRQIRSERRQRLVDQLDDLIPAVPDDPPPRRRPPVRVLGGRRTNL